MSASRFARVWTVLDQQLKEKRFPGYVAAIRYRGNTDLRVGGTLAFDTDAPMRPDTTFRIASLTKIVGGVLALGLVRDGVFALEDPVERWLPELADPRVLRDPGAELTDTEAAQRPITVRDLLAFTPGFGLLLEDGPLRRAMQDAQATPGPDGLTISMDEYLSRLGALPLARQPGSTWMYHTGMDVLGVLISRATGRTLDALIDERIGRPLGLTSTGFRTSDLGRLARSYQPTPDGLAAVDTDPALGRPPLFEALGGGLISTVPDYLRFLTVFDSANDVLAAPTAALMTADALTAEQRVGIEQLMGAGMSWGLGVGIDIAAASPWQVPGRFGWNGGTGTTAFVDPVNELTGVVFTQRHMAAPTGDFDAFWSAVYSAL